MPSPESWRIQIPTEGLRSAAKQAQERPSREQELRLVTVQSRPSARAIPRWQVGSPDCSARPATGRLPSTLIEQVADTPPPGIRSIGATAGPAVAVSKALMSGRVALDVRMSQRIYSSAQSPSVSNAIGSSTIPRNPTSAANLVAPGYERTRLVPIRSKATTATD